MWQNGVKIDLPNGQNPARSDKVFITGKKEVIGLKLDLKLQNSIEEYSMNGLIFEISLTHSVTCLSSNNPDGPDNWYSVRFNEDAKWQAPGPSMRTERIPGICHTNWIIGQTGFAPYFYCRIKISNEDQCIAYKRTLPFCDEPGTPRRAWREQVNYATGVLDLGTVYGNTRARSELLRTRENGLLKTSTASGTCSRGELPLRPVDGDQDVRFDDPQPTLISGDDQHVVLPCVQALYTLFLRNHNTIANAIRSEIASLNQAELDDEELYQRARKINIGVYQSVIVNEWLPFLLGTETAAAAPTMYDTTVTPGALIAADLVLKWIIPQGLPDKICSNDGTGPPSICDFQSSLETIAAYHADILSGVGESPFFGADCASDNFIRYVTSNQDLNEEMAESLHCNYLNNRDDLLARLIQTGRDHGVQGYERYRDFCGMDEASLEQSSPDQKKFLGQYQYRSDADLLVGGTTEEGRQTFLCLIRAQFNRLRLGDRFFYSHTEQKNGDKESFTPAFNENQRNYLNSRKLLHMICENTNVKSGYFINSFRGEKDQAGNFVPLTLCSELQKFDVTEFNIVNSV